MASGRTVSHIVDDLGFGMAQVRLMIFGAGLGIVNGMEMTLVKTLSLSMGAELGLHPYQRAGILSATLCGKMAGNYMNVLSDSCWARKLPILVGFVCSLLGGCLVALLTTSHVAVCGCWMLVGMGVGIAAPAWICLLNEVAPSRQRATMNSVIHTYFAGALILNTELDRFVVIVSGWRYQMYLTSSRVRSTRALS